MRFTVKAGALAREASLLVPLAGKRQSIPICGCILIRATSRGLSLTATDADTIMSASCEAQVDQPGGIAIDAKRLAGIATSYKPDATVSFEDQDGAWLSVQCGASKLRVPGLFASDFPSSPSRPEGKSSKVPADVLADLIAKTLFIAAEYKGWAPMNLLLADGRLRLAAMDGARCGIASKAVDAASLEFSGDKERFGMVAKLCKEAGSVEAVVIASEDRVWVTAAGREIVLKLETKKFPDTALFFKKARELGGEPFMVDRGALMDAIRRAEITSPGIRDDKHDGSTLTRLRLANSELSILAGSDRGQADEAIPVSYAGDERATCYSSVHLREFLAACQSERVKIRMPPDDTIGCILSDESGQHEYIVMPRAEAKAKKATA